MAFWDKEVSIVSVKKNKSENIEVKYVEKNEKSFYDIRISKADKDGVYHPTSNGVAIPESHWDTIIDAVKAYNKK